MRNVFQNIGNPDGRNTLNFSFGSNGDIIKTINTSFASALEETKEISKDFKGNSFLQSAQNVWDFLRNEINYKRDPQGYQLIRHPKRFLKDGQADCKSFSLFAASVLKNIYPDAHIYLRYASYDDHGIPTHVYCVAVYKNVFYIIDGVYHLFNKEKKYTNKKDFEMKIMTLSGFDSPIAGRKKKKSPQQEAKQSAPKKLKDRVKGVVKKAVKGGKRVGLAPTRAAFLGLVALNIKGLASKLKKANSENSAEVKNIWGKFGGDYDQLIKIVNKGAARKSIGELDEIEVEGIGVVTVATAAAAITEAAPVIAVFVGLFKKLKSTKDDKDGGSVEDLEKTSSDALASEGLTPDDAKEAANAPEYDKGTGSNKLLLYGGLGLAALVLLGAGKKIKI